MKVARLAPIVGLFALALGLNTLVSGCSLILNWDTAGLLCADNGECSGQPPHPHTCLNNHCITNGSVKVDGACVLDVQCDDNNLCINGKCAVPCLLSEAYTLGSCPAQHYCAPFYSTAWYYITTTGNTPTTPSTTSPPYHSVAACVAGDECTAGTTCGSPAPLGTVCTAIAGSGVGVNACLPGCSPSFVTGAYSDGCGSLYTGVAAYCSPVGQVGYQQMVCLNSNAPLAEGLQCTVAQNTCAPSYACINSNPGSNTGANCRHLCPPGSGTTIICEQGQTCVTYQYLNASSTAVPGDIPSSVGYCQ